MAIDFGRHSDDYARHRPGPPDSFYERLDRIAPLQGAKALDLATGPGKIALELAERGSDVCGLDISIQQVAIAGKIATERRLNDRARFWVGSAEQTALPSERIDLVTAGQCWHWFDRTRAIREILRVLRPGGTLAIVDYAYLADHSPVARDSEALILAMNPSWSMAGSNNLFPERIDEVIFGGFDLVESFCYDVTEEFSHAGWRGRMRTCNGVGSGGLTPEDVIQFDDALRELLSERYPEPLQIRHRMWCVVARKP